MAHSSWSNQTNFLVLLADLLLFLVIVSAHQLHEKCLFLLVSFLFVLLGSLLLSNGPPEFSDVMPVLVTSDSWMYWDSILWVSIWVLELVTV